MKVAVLPFNAGPGSQPALARQTANFAAEIAREATEADVNAMSYLVRAPEEGQEKMAFANLSEKLNDDKQVLALFDQNDADAVLEGLFEQLDTGGRFVVRTFVRGQDEPADITEAKFEEGQMLVGLRRVIERFCEACGGELPERLQSDATLFGTESSEAFSAFLIGFDALQYVERAQGRVISAFEPEGPLKNLVQTAEDAPTWDSPRIAAIRLARSYVRYRIGGASLVEGALAKITELAPQDAGGWVAMGEVHQALGRASEAVTSYEKASQLAPQEPSIWSRLGVAQMHAGMPANAEQSVRKAVDLEGEPAPSLDLLADLLTNTNRAHEVPALWQSRVDAQPTNALYHAKLATSLIRAGRQAEGLRAFDVGLERAEDTTLVKRWYAPALVQEGEHDQALKLYDELATESPKEAQLLLEYANALQRAERLDEIPAVLRSVFETNPDANVRAQTQAWLIELEEPRRVQALESARTKLEEGDPQGALAQIRPLRNWLADYWKMWALYAAALNQASEPEEAEEVSRKLIDMFPACEPAYGELRASLSAQERKEDAYDLMKRSLQNFPNSLVMALNFAVAAKESGREDEAKAMVQKVRAAAGENPQVESMLRMVEGQE